MIIIIIMKKKKNLLSRQSDLRISRTKCLGSDLHCSSSRPLWGFRGCGLMWGVWTIWRIPVQKTGNTRARCVKSCFHFLPIAPCIALFVFLCQVSLTYDALALAHNILFKQICRWRGYLANIPIKLEPDWIICQCSHKILAATVLLSPLCFSPF